MTLFYVAGIVLYVCFMYYLVVHVFPNISDKTIIANNAVVN
jgi:hypothetical protein